MKITKKYLPFVLAGLVGAGVYEAGKTLGTRAFNSGPVQRIVGTFRTYDESEVNPKECEVAYTGILRWGNNTIKFDGFNNPHKTLNDESIRGSVESLFKSQRVHYHQQPSYDTSTIIPTKAAKKPVESAGNSAGIYFRVSYKDTPDSRCKPQVVLQENGIPLRGAKIEDYSSDGYGVYSLESVIQHTEPSRRSYVAVLTDKAGEVQKIPIGTIDFDGKPFDVEPDVYFFNPGRRGGYLSITIHDPLDNRGDKLRSVKLTENGVPLELKLLDRSNPPHHGILREEWIHKPTPGLHSYEVKVVDNGGNIVTVNKRFDVKITNGN